jgi:hypothetical protein
MSSSVMATPRSLMMGSCRNSWFQIDIPRHIVHGNFAANPYKERIMETEILTSKQVRTRLGGYLVDLKYVDTKAFLISKVGEDDYVGVLTSARFLRENGIEIPAKGKAATAKPEDKVEEKPEVKKKK